MAGNYYYIVAGLPRLSLEGNKAAPPYKGFTDDLLSQLTPADAAILRSLRREFDCANLAARLDKRTLSFNPNGNLSAEALEEGIKTPDLLPTFMARVLDARAANRPIFPGLTLADTLYWLHFEDLSRSPSPFVRAFSTFEANRRNILAALNSRRFGRPIERAVVGEGPVADSLRKSPAPDFGLSPEFPWIARLPDLPVDNPLESELRIERLRFEVLDQLTVFDYFTPDAIFAFCVRLAAVERWTGLAADRGAPLFETALADARAGRQGMI